MMLHTRYDIISIICHILWFKQYVYAYEYVYLGLKKISSGYHLAQKFFSPVFTPVIIKVVNAKENLNKRLKQLIKIEQPVHREPHLYLP